MADKEHAHEFTAQMGYFGDGETDIEQCDCGLIKGLLDDDVTITTEEYYREYVNTGNTMLLNDIRKPEHLWLGRRIVIAGEGWEKTLMVTV